MLVFIIILYLLIILLCAIMFVKVKSIKIRSDYYEYKLELIEHFYDEYTKGRNAFTTLRDIKNLCDEDLNNGKETKNRT